MIAIKAFHCEKRQSKKRKFTPKGCLFNTESQALSPQTFCVRHSKKKKKLFSQFLKEQLVSNSHRRSVSLENDAKQKKNTDAGKRGVGVRQRDVQAKQDERLVKEALTQSQTEEQEGLLGVNPPGLVLQQGRQQSDLCLPALLNVRVRRGRRSSGGRWQSRRCATSRAGQGF